MSINIVNDGKRECNFCHEIKLIAVNLIDYPEHSVNICEKCAITALDVLEYYRNVVQPAQERQKFAKEK